MKDYQKVFGDHSEIIQYKKDEIILREEQIENFIYFIFQGIVVHLINKDGNVICKNFNLENTYFSSYSSFITRKPSAYSTIAIKNCVVERIHYNSIQEAYKISIEHQKNGRLMAESLFVEESDRTLSFITKSAEERYIELIENKPEFVQQVPLKYLASYLGITAYSLSRIRKKIAAGH